MCKDEFAALRWLFNTWVRICVDLVYHALGSVQLRLLLHRPCSSWILFSRRGCRWASWPTRSAWPLTSVRRERKWLWMCAGSVSLDITPATPSSPRKRRATSTLDSPTRRSTPVKSTACQPTTRTVRRLLPWYSNYKFKLSWSSAVTFVWIYCQSSVFRICSHEI